MDPRDLLIIGLEAAIAVQLLVFAAFLVFGGGPRTTSAWLLAGFTTSFAIQMIFNAAVGNDYWPWATFVRPVVALTIGPQLFLYVSSCRTNARRLSVADILHLLPALLGIPVRFDMVGISLDAYILFVLSAYLLSSLILLVSQRSRFVPAAVWRFLLILVVLFGALVALDLLIALQDEPRFRQRAGYLPALLVLLVITTGMLFAAMGNMKLLIDPSSAVRYAATPLDAADSARLKLNLVSLMNSEKPFCDAGLSLGSLAARLDIRPRHLSQLINSCYGLNFSAYINRLRIEEAAARLCNPEYAADSVTKIMYDVGFGSKSTFNREFRRQLGRTPAAYRQR